VWEAADEPQPAEQEAGVLHAYRHMAVGGAQGGNMHARFTHDSVCPWAMAV